jgi:hypothetical protein
MNMTGLRTTVTALALVAAVPALAASYGGAALVQARSEAWQTRGFAISSADLVTDGAGVRLHGSVCRTSLSPASAPSAVVAEHLDGGGRRVGSVRAPLAGSLSPRARLACAYYDVTPGWTLAAGDTVRICAVGRPEDRPCAPAN